MAQGPGEKQPQALGVAQGKGRDMSLSRGCGVVLEVGSREVCAFNQWQRCKRDKGVTFTWRWGRQLSDASLGG